MKKRTMIIPVYALFIFMSYLCGAHYRGDVGGPYQHILAIVQYYVIAGVIAAFVVNLVACFVSQKVFLSSLVIAFFCGFIGPLIIHIIVLIEPEPEAGMLYAFMFHFYGVVFLFSFIISAILKVVKSKKGSKGLQETEYIRQDLQD